MKADREKGVLSVINSWPEPGVKWEDACVRKAVAELDRFARLVKEEEVVWACDRPGRSGLIGGKEDVIYGNVLSGTPFA